MDVLQRTRGFELWSCISMSLSILTSLYLYLYMYLYISISIFPIHIYIYIASHICIRCSWTRCSARAASRYGRIHTHTHKPRHTHTHTHTHIHTHIALWCNLCDAPAPSSAGAAAEGWRPTCWIYIHVFLWRSYKNTNTVFRRIHPVYNMNTDIFKAHLFTKQAKYE